MLADAMLMAFAATADAARARLFYRETLGLRLVDETEFALVFDANGVGLRIQKVHDVAPAPYTQLGWSVTSIAQTMQALAERGVVFEQYGFPGQDEQGIWIAPGGARIAWFRDPDGNLLSLAQSQEDPA